MTRLTGKELRVRHEVFEVCESLFAKGYESSKDYTFDAVKAERVQLFGKGGHYETIKRYRDEWLTQKGLNVKVRVVQVNGEASSTEVPGVYGALDKFLEDRVAEIKAEFQQSYETQLYNSQKERDDALERVDAALSQQNTFKLMLDRKQAEIDGFSVMAKAHLEKTSELERINCQAEQEVQALSRRTQTIEQTHQKEIATLKSQYDAQIEKIIREKTELGDKFEQVQKQFTKSNDKLLDVNEKQRLDAMSERITLEDKLKKCEKDKAQLTINIEKKLGEYKENKTMLCDQNAELESEVTRYRQEKAKLERVLECEQQKNRLLEQVVSQQEVHQQQLTELTQRIELIKSKPLKATKA